MGFNPQYTKQRTLELYDTLPQDVEERKKCTDVRDEIFKLNHQFLGYVASHTFINNSAVCYEDKYQSACSHFMECWWWYHCEATHPKSLHLAFTSFYKLRISEMIRRELNEVKYSIRRSLCMKAAEQLGKHWGQVKYEDLAKLDLPQDEMNSLKAIFGTLHWADIAEHEMFLESDEKVSTFEYPDDKYDTLEEFLVHEMCEQEKRFSDKDLEDMSEIYGLSLMDLKKARAEAEDSLYNKLRSAVDLIDIQ